MVNEKFDFEKIIGQAERERRLKLELQYNF